MMLQFRLSSFLSSPHVRVLMIDGPGRLAVGTHPKRVRMVDFQKIGKRAEDSSDVGIVNGHGRFLGRVIAKKDTWHIA
jgi:hypothetical protein